MIDDGHVSPRKADETYGDAPLCPWCGEEVTDSPHVDMPDDDCVLECEHCAKLVRIRRSVRVSYLCVRFNLKKEEKQG